MCSLRTGREDLVTEHSHFSCDWILSQNRAIFPLSCRQLSRIITLPYVFRRRNTTEWSAAKWLRGQTRRQYELYVHGSRSRRCHVLFVCCSVKLQQLNADDGSDNKWPDWRKRTRSTSIDWWNMKQNRTRINLRFLQVPVQALYSRISYSVRKVLNAYWKLHIATGTGSIYWRVLLPSDSNFTFSTLFTVHGIKFSYTSELYVTYRKRRQRHCNKGCLRHVLCTSLQRPWSSTTSTWWLLVDSLQWRWFKNEIHYWYKVQRKIKFKNTNYSASISINCMFHRRGWNNLSRMHAKLTIVHMSEQRLWQQRQ